MEAVRGAMVDSPLWWDVCAAEARVAGGDDSGVGTEGRFPFLIEHRLPRSGLRGRLLVGRGSRDSCAIDQRQKTAPPAGC